MDEDGRKSAAAGFSSARKMTTSEMVEVIENVAGPFRGLQNLRDVLPTARSGHRPSSPEAAAKRNLGFGPADFPAVGASGGATPAAPAALTYEERETVIDQALLLLQDLYAHLPLKRALHAVDPVQRLRLLRMRHRALDERSFQSEMIDIFVCVRDLHTNYTLPHAYWPKFAFLPLRVEEYYVKKQRKYLVSWVSPVVAATDLVPGAEITHWNGMPIDLAVMRNAAREAGSNSEARRARGLDALTLRWLGASVPPDEDWVVLSYTVGGTAFETRFEWRIVERNELDDLFGATPNDEEGAAALGLDVKNELLRRVRKLLFDPASIQVEREMAEHRSASGPPPPIEQGIENLSLIPDVYPRFGSVSTASGTFGYVRLATFAPKDGDIDAAVDEFVRIVQSLPADGLILDVRGNGGGYINFGERLLQTLTPQEITPEPFHFATTALTIRLAESVPWLGQWKDPLRTALATGAGFSQGFPLTDPHDCNDIGQIYQGPVVLITDAFCYSTTDIFAAGFQDHRIGKILGCHDNTGAGGANVWDYQNQLQNLGISTLFPPLPGGTGMRVAIRRSTRVAAQSGVPLEDLGVMPDERYYMTRRDLLEQNADLIERAAAILKAQRRQTLSLAAEGAQPVKQLRVVSSGIDRVDVSIDDRPVASIDVGAGSTVVSLPKPVSGQSTVIAQGFREGVLVVSARWRP